MGHPFANTHIESGLTNIVGPGVNLSKWDASMSAKSVWMYLMVGGLTDLLKYTHGP